MLSAGLGRRDLLSDHPAADVQRLVGFNLTDQIDLVTRLLPRLNRSGRLVVVGSIAGALGVAEESVYAASKAGLMIFADSLRGELARRGVGVTVLVPGVVDTAFFDRRGAPYDRRLPRPVSAERVARALLRGLRRDRAEVVVPGWLRIPIVVRAVLPQTYARAVRRWG